MMIITGSWNPLRTFMMIVMEVRLSVTVIILSGMSLTLNKARHFPPTQQLLTNTLHMITPGDY